MSSADRAKETLGQGACGNCHMLDGGERGVTKPTLGIIRDVRRGRAVDSIEVTARDGSVLHLTVDGFGAAEARRHREELLRWLKAAGIPILDEGRE
jgi:hypothetical protein